MSNASLIEDEVQARSFVETYADGVAIERIERFATLLLEENQRQNLISKPSEGQIWQRHIADSAQLLRHVSRETLDGTDGDPWLDLGTGAGFPGIILSALLPNIRFVLVESRARRVEFLDRAVADLGLVNCTVIGERLERIKPFSVNVITARAFAPLEKLLRLSSPFSTKSTRYILPKGRSAEHELKAQKASIRKMFHVEQSLTDSEAGIIVNR